MAGVTGAGVVVCLPTYNEAANLPLVVEAVFGQLPECRVLVIDDNSPDNTGAVADGLARGNWQIEVLHRQAKEGLGRAYQEGFGRALVLEGVEFIAQMDADLSHPPQRLPAMLAAAEGADLVIGSRYVAEGGIERWGVHRRALSRFGSFYARLWLGVAVHDLTGGYKVWRRGLLEQVLCQPLCTGGYAFQVETTYVASRLGACIREVPIQFTERDQGKSKMSVRIAWEAFTKIPALARRYRGLQPDLAPTWSRA